MNQVIMETIKKHKLLTAHDVVLVAVSGGPDSMALLHWLWTNSQILSIEVICAHFNHGLRGSESDGDEAFVRQICRDWGIPFYAKHEALGEQLEAGGNLQALARERRYLFLTTLAEQIGAQKVAFGHHADDQLETIIMRFLRGTGLSGLIGMPYTRPLNPKTNLIRPFLDIPKKEIIHYLKQHNIPIRIDSSNLNLSYTRNRIRLELVPTLLNYNPNLSSILTLGDMLREDESFLQGEAIKAFDKIISHSNGNNVMIPLNMWRDLPVSLQRRVIKLICNYLTKDGAEVPYYHSEKVRELFMQDHSGKIQLPWGIEVLNRYGEGLFRLEESNKENMPFNYKVPIPGELFIRESGHAFRFTITDELSQAGICFDYDLLSGPFIMRSRLPGDRIALEGLDGHKKVKDLFIDEKIPRDQRDTIPLFFSNEELLWIPGVRKSKVGTISNATKRFLCCQFEKVI